MNKVYRVVYNETTHTYTAVAEIATAKGKAASAVVDNTSVVTEGSKKVLKASLSLMPAVLGLVWGFSAANAPAATTSCTYEASTAANAADDTTNLYCGLNSKANSSGTAIGASANAAISATALGKSANANAKESVALGVKAKTSAEQAIALGASAQADGDQSLALGANTRSNGNSSIAIGGDDLDRVASTSDVKSNNKWKTNLDNATYNNSEAAKIYQELTGEYLVNFQNTSSTSANYSSSGVKRYNPTTAGSGAVAVGVSSSAGDLATAFGTKVTASGTASTALGVGSIATGSGGVAVGAGAESLSEASVAVGTNSNASAETSIAVGDSSEARGINAISVGHTALATVAQAVAIGPNAQATQISTVALGGSAQASATQSTALGENSRATGSFSTAAGSGASASNTNTIAIGIAANASGEYATSVGAFSQATATRSTALGNLANASSAYAVAVGDDSAAKGENSIAVGRNTDASATDSIAIGNSAQALAAQSISIGTGNIVSGQGSGAIGDPSYISGTGTYTLGNDNGTSTAPIAADEAGAFGNNNAMTANADGSRIVGNNNTVSGANTFVVGNSVTATAGNNVILGNASSESSATTTSGVYNQITTGSVSGITYGTFAGTAAGVVSVGAKGSERQIINVAPGQVSATSTDAINGSQLYSVASTLGNQVSNTYFHTNTGSSSQGAGNAATNLGLITDKAGATGTRAVTAGVNTAANGSQAVAVGASANAAAADSVALGSSANVGSNSSNSIALGKSATVAANAANAIAMGSGATNNSGTSVVIGNNASITASNSGSSVVIGDNAGISTTGGSFAVVIGSGARNSGTTNNTAIGRNANVSGQMATALGALSYAHDSYTVATGFSSNATGEASMAMGKQAMTNGGNAIAMGSSSQASGANNVAIGANTKASNGRQSVAVGSYATTNGDFAVAMGQNAQASQNEAVSIGMDTKAVLGAVALGPNSNASANYSIAMGKSAVTSGGGAVALGVNANAAGSSSLALGLSATTVGANSLAMGNGANASSAGAIAMGLNSKATGGSAISLGASSSASGSNAISLGSSSNASGNDALAFGSSSKASGNRAISFGLNANASVDRSVALGDWATTTAAVPTTSATVNGISYSGFAGTSPVGVVSVGNATEKRQIQNVAAGQISASSTDAINGSQLYATNNVIGNVATSTKKILGGNAAVASDGTISMSNIGGTGKSTVDEAIKAANSKVAAGTNVASVNTTTGTDGSTTYTVNAKGTTVSNGSDKVSVTSTAKADNVTDYAVDLSDSAKASLIKADSAVQSFTTSVNGTSVETIDQSNTDVNFVNGTGTTARSVDGNITFDVNKSGLTTDSAGNVTADTAGDNFATAEDVADAINKATAATEKTSSVVEGSNTHVSSKVDGNNTEYTVSADKATVSVSDALKKTESTSTDSNGAVTTDYALDLSDETKESIQKGVDAKTAVDNQGLTFTGDSGSTDVKKLGSSVAVNGDSNITTTATSDGIKVALNKDLTGLNSVTATTLNGDTLNVGPVVINSDGINAGNTVITNVASGGNTDTNAANIADVKKAAAAAKSKVEAGTNVASVDESTATDGSTTYTVNAKGTTVSNGSDKVSVTSTSKADNVTDYAVDLSTSAKESLAKADSAIQSFTTSVNGSNVETIDQSNTDVNFINGTGTTARASGNDITFDVNKSGLTTDSAGNVTANTAGDNFATAADVADAINKATAATEKTSSVAAGSNTHVSSKVDGNNTEYTVSADKATVSVSDALKKTESTSTDSNGAVTTDYALDLSDETKADIAKGVDAKTAVDSQGLTFTGDSGSTDVKKLGSSVAVNGDSNITTTATSDGIKVALNKDLTGLNSVTATTITGDTLNGNTLNVGPVVINSDGINAGNKVISNVADGNLAADSKEAVNGSQLYTTNQNVTTNANNIAANTAAIEKGINYKGNDGTAINQALGGTINIVGANSGNDTDAGANIFVRTNGDNVTVELAKALNVDSVTTGDTVLDNSGVAVGDKVALTSDGLKAGDVSVSTSGINAGNQQITNVAEGTKGTDAVNLNQLNAVKAAASSKVAAGTNVASVETSTDPEDGSTTYTVNAKGTTVSNGSDKVSVTTTAKADNVTDYAVDLSDSAKESLAKADSAVQSFTTSVNGTSVETIDQSNTDVNFVNGTGTTARSVDGNITFDINKSGLTTDSTGNVTANTAGDNFATAADVADAINKATAATEKTSSVVEGSNIHVSNKVNGNNTEYTVSADKATVSVSDALVQSTTTVTDDNGAVTTDYKLDLAQSTKDDIQKGVDAKDTVDSQGLTFTGDSGSTDVKKLGSSVAVNGDSNITTTATSDGIKVALNKDLTGLNSVTATTITGDTLNGNTLNVGPVVINSDGINAGNKVISNVADGNLAADSKEAVNGSQLYTTNQNVTTNANNIAANTAAIEKGINYKGNDGTAINQALGGTINIVGTNSGDNTDAGANIFVRTNGDNVTVELAKALTVDSVTAGDTVLNNSGVTVGDKVALTSDGLKAGDVSVSTSGINAGNQQITNVAEGTKGTDAVNLNQLNAVKAAASSKVAAGTNVASVGETKADDGSITYTVNAKGTTASKGSDAVTVTAGTPDADNVTDYVIDLSQASKDSLAKADTAVQTLKTSADGTDAQTLDQTNNTANFISGDNIELTASSDGIKVATKKDVTFDSVTTGDSKLTSDGITINNGIAGNSVSLTKDGLNNGGNQITNVASGGDVDTNAANIADVKKAAAAATTKVTGNQGVSVNPSNNEDGSVTYTVAAKTDGTTIKVNDEGNLTANTTTLTADNAGKVATPAEPNALITAGDVANAINAAGFTAKANGDDGELINAGDEVEFINGNNIEITRNGGKFTVATAKDVKFDSVTTGNTVMNTNGVTVGDNVALTSDGLKAGDVSVSTAGINAGNKQITNVSSGLGDTKLADASGDTLNNAANIGDLQAAAAAATTKVTGDQGVSVTPSNNEDGSVTYTVAAKTDGTTIKVNDEGNLTANTTTLTADNAGKVATPAEPNALITAGDVANAINAAGFTAKANGDDGELINAGDEVEFINGDNIEITRNGGKFTVATAKDVKFDSVTTGNTVMNTNGVTVGNDVALTSDGLKAGDVSVSTSGINAGNKQITNVASGGDVDTNAANIADVKKAAAAATTKVTGDQGVSVNPSNNEDGSVTYTVAAKTDGTTIKVNDEGNLTANTTTLTADNAGKVVTPAEPNALITAGDVANAINAAGFTAKANGDDGELINAGDEVDFINGDNIEITRNGGKFTVATAKDVKFDSVTTGNTVMNTNGVTVGNNVALTSDGLKAGDVSVSTSGINAGNKQISNVASGLGDTKLADASGDTLNNAANIGDLQAAAAAATTKVAGNQGVSVNPSNNEDGSITYTVAAKTDGTTIKVNDEGNLTANTTTLTADNAGKVATPAEPNALITAGDVANAINAVGFTAKANGDDGELINAGDEVEFINGDNIEITRDGGKFTVATAKDVKFDSVTTGDSKLTSDGITINNGTAGSPVSLTKDGLNNGGNQITNVASGGDVDTNAANIADVKKAAAAATTTVSSDDKSVTLVETKDTDGHTNYDLSVAKANVTVNEDGSISNTNPDGNANSFVTGDALANAVNNAGFTLTAQGANGSLVKAGSTIDLKNTDGNIVISKSAANNDVLFNLADALKVGSVNAGGTKISSDGLTFVDNDGNKVANSPSISKTGVDAGNNVISNVANGVVDTDAVNVSQLNDATNSITTKGLDFAGDSGETHRDLGQKLTVSGGLTDEAKATAGNIGVFAKDGQLDVKLAKDVDLGSDGSIKAGDTTVNNDGVKVGDNVALTKNGLKAGDTNVTTDGVKVGDKVNLNKEGLNIGDNVSLTENGLDNGGNKITNVAAGVEDTDAVNVSQLNKGVASAKTEVKAGKNMVVTPSTGTNGQTIYTVATSDDLAVNSVKAGDNVTLNTEGVTAGNIKVDAASNKITGVEAGNIAADSKDVVNGSQLYSTNQNVANNAANIAKGISYQGNNGTAIKKQLGETINIVGANEGSSTDKGANIFVRTNSDNVTVELAKDVKGLDSLTATTVNADTVKAGNTTIDTNGVTIAAPTEANPNNTVSLSPIGLNNGGNTITNVAPGKNGTDAVNLDQLSAVGNTLQNNINNVGKKAYAGVAGAIAQSSIPQVTRPGATGIGIGSGYYGGESAMAIGVSSMSDGGNWIVKGNFSTNTGGHIGVGAGALYQW